LISDGGLVWEYGDSFSEVGTRGLEGVAVMPLSDGSSQVAVVWEGGHIRGSDVPRGIRQLDGLAADPQVFIHRIRAGAKWDPMMRDSGTTVTLHVSQPSKPTRATAFRVPDLVWHKASSGDLEFIAILNSFDSLRLQRFSASTGEALGEPLDLGTIASIPDSVRKLKPNWEGLGWFEDGRSLILIDDRGQTRNDKMSPFLAIVPLPSQWQ
jgi:hypothetical protein